MKLSMPAEWAPHERTWMAWPSAGYTLGETAEEAEAARTAWAQVANAIINFEPLSMLVETESLELARAYLDARIEIIEAELNDAWMRDIGPTFVKDQDGNLAAINWVFNGWGAQGWAEWDKDALVASFVGMLAGAEVLDSELVNEGGGIHVNGQGAVLLTETVQLGEGRNPDWTKAEVEEELAEKLGVSKAIWLKRGLTRDYEEFGTRGHIDIVACFADDNTILYHDQQDPTHPDFEISQEVRRDLENSGDWNLIALPAPKTLRDEGGFVDYSYVNHYLVNGGVIGCAFADENDELAKQILKSAYPGREVVMVDAREIFARGGGIHCITQQQPL